MLGNGEPYRSGALWKDIYASILNAKHFVYIGGESTAIPGAEHGGMRHCLGSWLAENCQLPIFITADQYLPLLLIIACRRLAQQTSCMARALP